MPKTMTKEQFGEARKDIITTFISKCKQYDLPPDSYLEIIKTLEKGLLMTITNSAKEKVDA